MKSRMHQRTAFQHPKSAESQYSKDGETSKLHIVVSLNFYSAGADSTGASAAGASGVVVGSVGVSAAGASGVVAGSV